MCGDDLQNDMGMGKTGGDAYINSPNVGLEGVSESGTIGNDLNSEYGFAANPTQENTISVYSGDMTDNTSIGNINIDI